MFKPPFAAAATAALVMLAGSPFGASDAYAVAVYTGTFDPRGDVYGFDGTHRFEVDESCLSTTGWKAVNADIYASDTDFTYSKCGNAFLTGGSLTVRKYSSAEKDSQGNYTTAANNSVVDERNWNFADLTSFGDPLVPDQGSIFGIFVAYNANTGRNELAGVDTFWFGSFGDREPVEDRFDGLFWWLRWASGALPTDIVFNEYDPFAYGYSGWYQTNYDPVFLGTSDCPDVGEGCDIAEAAVPPAIPTFVRQPSLIPEPGSLLLVGAALAAAWLSRRRASVR